MEVVNVFCSNSACYLAIQPNQVFISFLVFKKRSLDLLLHVKQMNLQGKRLLGDTMAADKRCGGNSLHWAFLWSWAEPVVGMFKTVKFRPRTEEESDLSFQA